VFTTDEKRILEYMAGYGFQASSLAEAIEKTGKDTMGHIRSMAYNDPDAFGPDLVQYLLDHMDVSPYDVYAVLHVLAERRPDQSAELMDLYRDNFARFPKDAIEEFYYVIANDKELVTKELMATEMANASANPFRVIMSLRMLLAKRPELMDRRMVEWARDNLGAGANQAFYFLRDIATKFQDWAPISVQGLFQCVLTFHSNAYKKDFLRDIVTIAHASHVKRSFAEELRRPTNGGNPAARDLMAMIFRERNQRLQGLWLEAMDKALDWDHVWDFFVLLLENPISRKDMSTDAAERFLDGTYRLAFLLSPHEFRQAVYENVDMTDAKPKPYGGKLAFLDKDGIPELRGKVEILAERLGEKVVLEPVDEFLGRGKAMEEEARSLQEHLSKEMDPEKKVKMSKRLENLQSRLKDLDSMPERALNDVRAAVARDLRAHLAKLSDILMVTSRKEAVRRASKRVLGYETNLWETDEKVYPALLMAEKLGGNNRKYLIRLIEDRLNGREHDWLWTEPPVIKWIESVKKAWPEVDMGKWRHPFTRTYNYSKGMTEEAKNQRIAEELAQVRERMKAIDIKIQDNDGHAELLGKLEKADAKHAAVVSELKDDLERIRKFMVAPVTDFEGDIILEVESDPFQYLFMGEYGFASCLSMQGSNFWGCVSNAIDIDKCVIWLKDPHGNSLARRLIALTPQGMVSYRTYSNRQALSSGGFFRKFIREYAKHCGVGTAKEAKPHALLSDRWYDDGTVDI